MKKITLIVLIAVLMFSGMTHLNAEEPVRELYHTYLGPVVGSGFNRISASDWFTDRTSTKKISGNYYTGGAALKIFVKNIEGDFSFQYMYNADSDYALQHFYYAASAKYLFGLTNLISLSTGAGLYFESPPSNKKYDGSTGFFIPLGMIYQLSFDTRLFLELKGSYGSYGIGENSVKFSYGIDMGAVFKVGRL